jgi:hypothetical protein
VEDNGAELTSEEAAGITRYLTARYAKK